jgi:histidine ammonia-lyase
MGATSAVKLLKVMDNLDIILSIELMNAAQALEFRRPLTSSPLIEKVIKEYRKEVPFIDEDIVMYKEIRKSTAFLNRLEPDFA